MNTEICNSTLNFPNKILEPRKLNIRDFYVGGILWSHYGGFSPAYLFRFSRGRCGVATSASVLVATRVLVLRLVLLRRLPVLVLRQLAVRYWNQKLIIIGTSENFPKIFAFQCKATISNRLVDTSSAIRGKGNLGLVFSLKIFKIIIFMLK